MTLQQLESKRLAACQALLRAIDLERDPRGIGEANRLKRKAAELAQQVKFAQLEEYAAQ